MSKYFYATLLMVLFSTSAWSQGNFSGDVMLNANYYVRDTAIGAADNPFYDNLKTGGESWFNLNYANPELQLRAGVRFDAFLNSNIFNPLQPVNDIGLGIFFVNKQIGKLNLHGGHFYEQFGSGTTFRAYELRPLGIDQAVLGVKARYDLLDNLSVTGFMGRRKNRLDTYPAILMGGNVDANFALGKEKNFYLYPGFSVLNRTMDQADMNQVVATIESYDSKDRFIPKYNVYVYSVYNTMNYKNFSWYVEYAAKTEETIANLDGTFINSDGFQAFSSLAYSRKGFGVTLQGKVTDHFSFRTSPNETFLDGIINYLPALTKQNSFRLPARYSATTQEIDEIAIQADVVYTPKKGLTFTANYSNLRTSEGERLYEEYYLDADFKKKKSPWHFIVGLQMVDYNRFVYEQKGDFVQTLTPFIEVDYKITRKKSLRAELQYMLTERNRKLFGSDDPEKRQDLGDWLFGLLEYNIAPKWSLSVTDMYNFDDKQHYYSILAAYTKRANRFTLSYVKQVEGVVCTGGVCRLEPAFSGAKFTMTSSF